MAVFSAVGKREARRIGEAAGGSVHDLRNQSERLQSARSKLLQQQQRRKVVKLSLIRHCQNRAETLRMDIRRANFVVAWKRELSHVGKGVFRMLIGNGEQRLLRGGSLGVNQIHDHALMLADDRSVRLGHEV